MTGITGMATTYNCPNYVGELFNASPEDTPFLSAIGGLTGGESTGSKVFSWSGYDLRDAEDGRQRTEGAAAPSPESRKRFQATNVLEIHQEAFEVSYTQMGVRNMIATDGAANVQGGPVSPIDEIAFQAQAQIKQVARDVEKSFLVGKFQNPTDNTQPRKTRGLAEAITTNVATSTHTADQLTKDEILDLFQKVWDNGGIQESETRTVIVGSAMKRILTKLFITDVQYREQERNVGGVSLKTFETDFGSANIMLNRYAPEKTIIVCSLEQCAPRFLEIPGKGHFFAEPLAKTGASERYQLYGEIGLQYGNEKAHGKLTCA